MLSEGRSANSFAIQNTCSERCNEPLGYYCENCEIVGCSHCMLRSHKRHSYLSLLQKVCIAIKKVTGAVLKRNTANFLAFVFVRMKSFCRSFTAPLNE